MGGGGQKIEKNADVVYGRPHRAESKSGDKFGK